MKRWVVFTLVGCLAALLSSLLTVCHADSDEGPSITAPQRVFTQNGQTYVQLGSDTQKAIGLKTKTLTSAQYHPTRQAYGQVIAPGPLLKGYHRLASASAHLAQAKAHLATAHAEYQRLEHLYRQQHNVAKKQVQQARATWQSDKAAVRQAQARRTRVQGDLVAQWGNQITGWMQHNSSALKAVSAGRRRLLRLTLPAGEAPAAAPQKGRVVLPGGATVPVTLVSPAPTTPAGLQGSTYYFKTSSDLKRLGYGLQVTARLAFGSSRHGVIVPDSAIVWSHGAAWVYVKIGPQRFQRRPVRTDTPAAGGWFQPTGLGPGTPIVIHGAQILYSIQTLANGSHGSEGDED